MYKLLLNCSSVFGVFIFFDALLYHRTISAFHLTLSFGVEFETKEIKDAAYGGFLISSGVSMSFTLGRRNINTQ